jgi:hypothetical protein
MVGEIDDARRARRERLSIDVAGEQGVPVTVVLTDQITDLSGTVAGATPRAHTLSFSRPTRATGPNGTCEARARRERTFSIPDCRRASGISRWPCAISTRPGKRPRLPAAGAAWRDAFDLGLRKADAGVEGAPTMRARCIIALFTLGCGASA